MTESVRTDSDAGAVRSRSRLKFGIDRVKEEKDRKGEKKIQTNVFAELKL